MPLIPLIALAGGLLVATPAEVTLRGIAHALDGDTLELQGRRVRLVGIDAPESRQTCRRSARQGGESFDCGALATEALRALIEGREVRCLGQGEDRYRRQLATCAVDRQDLGSAMVRQGWAVAYTRYTARYLGEEIAARNARRGLWSGEFELPEGWRANARRSR